MEFIKTVNGHKIYRLSREELNDMLIKSGDWSIDYYVPGRVIKLYYITINRSRYNFETLQDAEEFCSLFNKKHYHI